MALTCSIVRPCPPQPLPTPLIEAPATLPQDGSVPLTFLLFPSALSTHLGVSLADSAHPLDLGMEMTLPPGSPPNHSQKGLPSQQEALLEGCFLPHFSCSGSRVIQWVSDRWHYLFHPSPCYLNGGSCPLEGQSQGVWWCCCCGSNNLTGAMTLPLFLKRLGHGWHARHALVLEAGSACRKLRVCLGTGPQVFVFTFSMFGHKDADIKKVMPPGWRGWGYPAADGGKTEHTHF